MFIIVSGIDQAGKTTIAKKISDNFNIPYLKFSGPGTLKTHDSLIWARDSIIFHVSILRLLEKLYEQHVEIAAVFDRFYPDEIVYSKIFRNLDLFEEYKEIDERFASIGTILIYMEPPPIDILRERWKNETRVSIEKVDVLANEFNKFMNYTKLSIFRMSTDFSFDNFDKIRNLIKNLSIRIVKK